MNELKQQLLSYGIFYDNDYFNKYIELINNNKNRSKEVYKTNSHHIIPRSYFKRNNIDIDNSDNNTVNLLYKDHILAHYYFCLCTSIPELKWDSEYSIRYILNNKNFKCLPEYSQERELIESLDKLQELYEELKHHIGDIHRGKKLSNKQREILSTVNKRPKSEETKKKISLSKKGIKCKESTKEKLSIINKGKKLSEETKKKISDNSKINENYGFRGKHQTEESKKLISEKALLQWSSEEMRDRQSERQRNRKFHWYNNGDVCIQINDGDEIPSGFIKGRFIKHKGGI